MRGSGDPHPDHLTGSDPPYAQNTTSSGPGVWVQRPHGPRWSVSQLLIPSPWRWGSIHRDGHGPNGNGDGGLCRCGPWCTPPPSPPCSPSTYHHPIPPIPSLGAHGHHAIWLMTANGPPPISVIQTSGSSSAMAWIHPYPSVHHPSVHPYAMAVGSIRREGHGANGTRDGGPYTTRAHTTTSITTTYGCGHHHADTAMHLHSSWRYRGHQLTPPIPPTPVLAYPYTHPLVSSLWMSTRNGWYGDQWLWGGHPYGPATTCRPY